MEIGKWNVMFINPGDTHRKVFFVLHRNVYRIQTVEPTRQWTSRSSVVMVT